MSSILEYSELIRKYNHTWASVQIKKTGEIFPAFFDNMRQLSDESYNASFTYTKPELATPKDRLLGSNKTHSTSLPFNEFEILPTPDSQVFDSQGHTIVFTRNPQRQWQRGINNSNSRFYRPIANLTEILPSNANYKVLGRERLNWELYTFQNLFVPFWAGDFANALADMEKYALLSRTIDGKYFVSHFPSSVKSYVLFRLDIPVAYYNSKMDVFTLVDQIYTQEMQDFIRINDLNSKIEV